LETKQTEREHVDIRRGLLGILVVSRALREFNQSLWR